MVWSIWGIHNRPLDWWGDIGSILGGITAPVTSFLSALLLYLTFKQQQDSLSHEVSRNQVLRDIERIKEQFVSVTEYLHRISVTQHNSNYTGLQAIHAEIGLHESMWTTQEFLFVVEQLMNNRTQIERIKTMSNIPTIQELLAIEKEQLINVMTIYAQNIILPCFNSIIEQNEVKINNGSDASKISRLNEVKDKRSRFMDLFNLR